MAHLGAEIKRHGQIDLVLLFLAVAAMATAPRLATGSIDGPKPRDRPCHGRPHHRSRS